MKIIKGLLLIILVLVVIGLIIGLASPKEINVEHSQKLDASPEAVFHQVNDLKNWDNWSVWNQMDPDMKKEYNAQTSGEGATYSWESDDRKVGDGSMTITKSVPYEEVQTKLDFGDKGTGTSGFYIEPTEDGGSTVRWTMHSDLGNNPMIRLMGKLMMTPSIEKAYQSSLDQMDDYIEANPEAANPPAEYVIKEIKIEVDSVESFDVLATKRSIKISEMDSDVYAQGYAEVMGSLDKQGLEMSGPPVAVYEEWDLATDKTVFFLGIPTTTKGKLVGTVNNYNIEGGKVIVADYYGPYEESGKGHDAIEAYMEAENLEFRGPVWEEYVTDPNEVESMNEVLTRIFYGVK